MKKIPKILLILTLFFPLVLNAQTKEVKEYRWYTLKETNVHFDKDVENNCEYFDKNDYIYSNWVYLTKKPSEEEGRIIEEVNEPIKIPIYNTYRIKIYGLENYTRNVLLNEIEIYDKDMNELKTTFVRSDIQKSEALKLLDKDYLTSVSAPMYLNLILDLPRIVDLRDLTIKITYNKEEQDFFGIGFNFYVSENYSEIIYASYMNETTKECNDEVCTLTVKPKSDEYDFSTDLDIYAMTYRYKDKYYKCYNQERVYVPGYYENLEGFIKDEDKYRITKTNEEIKEVVKTIEAKNENQDKETLEEEEELKELEETETNEEETNIIEETEEHRPIALLTETTETKKINKPLVFTLIFLSLSLILTVILLIVKKCRMK